MTNPPRCHQCPSVFDPHWRHAVLALAMQWSGSVTPVVVYLLLILDQSHTPSIAFRHPPRNSARIGYATEGLLFISPHLSTDAVSELQTFWVLIRLWKKHTVQACT